MRRFPSPYQKEESEKKNVRRRSIQIARRTQWRTIVVLRKAV